MDKVFSKYITDIYFHIKSPIRNTSNIIEAPAEYIMEICRKNQQILETLKFKHKTDNPREALELEKKELAKKWEPSEEAKKYIEELNNTYKGKTIEFYKNPERKNSKKIYKTLCVSIEIVNTEDGKVPMLITKGENCTLFDIADIKVIKSEEPID